MWSSPTPHLLPCRPLICIDPGHARRPNFETEPIGPGSKKRKIVDGGGAPGEAPVVLAISTKTRALLKDRGFRVAMTRTTPTSRSRREATSPGRGSATGGTRRSCSACTRTARTDSRAHGVSTLYPWNRRGWTSDIYRPSVRAAGIVQRQVVRATGALSRGLVRRSDSDRVQLGERPGRLAETGFMTNSEGEPEAQTSGVLVEGRSGLGSSV